MRTVDVAGWYSIRDGKHQFKLFNKEGKFMSQVIWDTSFDWPCFKRWVPASVGLTGYQAAEIIFDTEWRAM